MKRWADRWVHSLTLEEASRLIEFDLFDDDVVDTRLSKKILPVSILGNVHPLLDLAVGDSEKRFASLEYGIRFEADWVPPIVFLEGEGLRDGNHRLTLAVMYGLKHVPAYTDIRG